MPWQANAQIITQADSKIDAYEICGLLNRYAIRIGAGCMFSTYDGPQDDA